MNLKSRVWIEVVAGIFFGLTILVAGYRLYSLGQVNSAPLNSTAQLGLTYLLGSTWGYNFGSAIRKDVKGRAEFVLLAAFFGTLISAFAGYALYSAIFDRVSDTLFSVALLAFSMIAFTAFTQSEVVDKAHLKQLLEVASNKASPVILSGYATATVSDPYWGVSVSIGVAVTIAALPRFVRRLVKRWKDGKLTVVNEI